MAIVNIGAAGTHTFNFDDTVTFTATHTEGDGDSIVKGDTLPMDTPIAMNAGVVVTIDGTALIDIQGQRPDDFTLESGMVEFDSAATDKVRGDWGYFSMAGSNNNNTMKWCVFKNATYGLLFLDHNPASGKFQYLAAINMVNEAILHDQASSGASVLDDILLIRTSGTLKNDDAVVTWSRITSLESLAALFLGSTQDITVNDIYHDAGSAILDISTAVGKTFIGNRIYCIAPPSETANSNTIAGTADLEDCIFTGFGSPFLNDGAGQADMLNCDAYGGERTANAGLHGVNANAFALDNCYIAGNRGADADNVDTDDTIPTSASTPAQYINAQSLVNARSSRNFDRTITSPVANVATAGEATITCTTGMIARIRVLLYRSAADLDKGKVIASDWSVPVMNINGGFEVPSIVSDWGPEAGVKYGTSHSIKVDFLEGGDYFWDIEAEGVTGEVFRLGEQSAITVQSSVMGGVNFAIE